MGTEANNERTDSEKPAVYHYDPANSFYVNRVYSVRERIFRIVFDTIQPTENMKVLDVGVTGDREHAESNLFEKFYPFPHRITAVGVEDSRFLEDEYPGLQFVRVEPGQPYPFDDGEFDFVMSHAVVEHVGLEVDQRTFIEEIIRVGHTTCITTPNRFYPIELHVWLPFVHWLPRPLAQSVLRTLGYSFYGEPGNLTLLSKRSLRKLYPGDVDVTIKRFRFLGLVSNYLAFTGLNNLQ